MISEKWESSFQIYIMICIEIHCAVTTLY
jgi:hypothetical protein